MDNASKNTLSGNKTIKLETLQKCDIGQLRVFSNFLIVDE